MSIKFTEKDYETIAHIATINHLNYSTNPDETARCFMARCYTNAVLNVLTQKGIIIDSESDHERLIIESDWAE